MQNRLRGALAGLSLAGLLMCGSFAGAEEFQISRTKSHVEISYGDRPLVRLMIRGEAGGTPTDSRRVFTHIMDPLDADGRRALTRCAADPPGHRCGVFLGWRETAVSGAGPVDTWTLDGAARQEFSTVLRRETTGQAAFLTVRINWMNGSTKLLEEHRTLVVHRPPSDRSLLFDQLSTLHATTGSVSLKGGSEFGGYQVQLHRLVKEKKSARYMFPPARELQEDRVPDWFATKFTIDDRPYTIQFMSNPSHPDGKQISAYRKSGRFGFYVPDQIKKGEKATYRLRLFVRAGSFPKKKDALSERFRTYVRQLEAE